MVQRIGLLVGREWSFPPVFIEQVKRRHEGVIAELVMLGGTRSSEPCPYALLIDRISHQVPYYRSYLKKACQQGVPIINNPFLWTADDRFYQAAVASSLGVATPRTVVLPNKDYGPDVVHAESLRNLIYPLDWSGIIDHVGLPCVLKDAHSGDRHALAVCHSLDHLIECYNQSGCRTLIAQQFLSEEHPIRCLVLGQQEVLPIRYDPREQKCASGNDELDPKVRQQLVGDSLKLARTLGYDLTAVDWTIHEGTPYVLDFMNPAPSLDVNVLTPGHFDWVVRQLVELAIRMVKDPRSQRQRPYHPAPSAVRV